jgi:unsaturated chondroitin disaccharide hydrolase
LRIIEGWQSEWERDKLCPALLSRADSVKNLSCLFAALLVLLCGRMLRAQQLVAVDEQAETPQNVPVTIPVLANDTDAATNQMAILQVTQPSHGQVTINSGGVVSNPVLTGLFQFAAIQLSNSVAQIGDTNLYPWETQSDGTWHAIPSDDNNWISGFFPGLLWLIYEHTGDTNYLAWAENWMAGIAPEQFSTNTDDVGFMIQTSFGNGCRLTGNPAFEAVLLQTAQSLSNRFNPVVGCLADDQLLTPPPFEVIMDTMMNSQLLYTACDLGGSTNFYNMALSHAGRTLTNQFRADGSTYQQVIYDAGTGAVISQGNRVGIPAQDTWARGHSWATYGFTMAFEETGDARFLDAAERAANYYIDNVPADYVPYWYYQDPAIPNALRDSSAAAVTLSALVELSQLAGNSSDAASYWQAAHNVFTSLSSTNYLAQGTTGSGILLQGDPVDTQTAASLIYGDYYFVEALKRYNDIYSQTTVTYIPEPGFQGADSFTCQVCDSAGNCATATVNVAVGSPAPDPSLSISSATQWPTISFQSAAGSSYFVQFANSLTTATAWTDLATNLAGTGGVVSVTDTNIAPARFYRIGQSQ